MRVGCVSVACRHRVCCVCHVVRVVCVCVRVGVCVGVCVLVLWCVSCWLVTSSAVARPVGRQEEAVGVACLYMVGCPWVIEACAFMAYPACCGVVSDDLGSALVCASVMWSVSCGCSCGVGTGLAGFAPCSVCGCYATCEADAWWLCHVCP